MDAPMRPDKESERGLVTWASSDEDSGPDCGISVGLGDGRILWCGEISRNCYEQACEEAAALGDDFGWWIILFETKSTTVIGKCMNQYVAQKLVEQIAAALRSTA